MDENAQKQRTDDLAGSLLELDDNVVKGWAAKASAKLLKHGGRIIVTGGAGSGKTTFAKELARILEVPHFDLDTFIKGGYTPDKKVYEQRLIAGLMALWNALPRGGYVVEHVLAARPDILQALRPDAVILLNATDKHLIRVASGRAVAAREDSPNERIARALQTGQEARNFYESLAWKEEKDGRWKMKLRSEG